ncbi:SDR family oxidoreductase [Mycobacterium sp. UM_CSW]|uniref:SDR family oxidoreductase n=1 Tax=Mycobacterium sp. UM_CSW TaxID=1370119 RepID=UPI00082A1EA6|nr:SDR family oxidoreductase [Mycobacterium sp. UM_CSW]
MRELCVVTGGAGGMGLAAAKIVGQERLVVISDVSPGRLQAASAELQSLDIECVAVNCDVTDRSSVAELIATARSLGSVTSVIHTAGVSPRMGDAEYILRINALGTVHVNEAFLPLASEGFAIVNVASMATHVFPRLFIPKRRFKDALRNEDRFMAKMTAVCKRVPAGIRPGLAYSISKNFVTWYSASQAGRFGSRGARIVSVSPGSIDTEMGRLEEQAGSGAMVKLAALKRFGKPEEVAEVLAFCASTKAGYLTGVDIACDGGVLAAFTLKNMIPLATRTT